MTTGNNATKQAKEEASGVKNLSNNVEKSAETAKEKNSDDISNIAGKVQGKAASDQGYLADKVDKVGQLAQNTLDKAGQLGNRAADVISNSTEYVKNFDADKARESVKDAIKEKPELTIVAVALLGLVVGFMVGRRSS